MSDRPKVLVSGCYDLLHAGHVTFFETASEYGDLHVCIGSDENIRRLKHHDPMFTQEERLYLVQSMKCVAHARVCSGSGMLDYEPDMAEIRPDYFIVNHDGGSDAKRALCEKYGVKYLELPRDPKPGLPARSSTAIKASLGGGAKREIVSAVGAPASAPSEPHEAAALPYRICLAGGWMDQPWVSELHPGSVVVVNIHPTREFNLRSGMATSSRVLWQKLQSYNLYPDDPVELARLLFGYENPPGTKYISGSQDHLGLTLPGINRLFYNGHYWPERIESTCDQGICDWLEQSLVLVELFERPSGYDPLLEQHINVENVKRLGLAGDLCWEAILAKDIRKLGLALSETHRAWGQMLPLTTSREIEAEMDKYPCYGRVTSGSGGGYIVMATDAEIPGGFRARIRRSTHG
ncbi:MAG: adenylyltransferase/cytidyltransferase family protein [Planctomycetota bacterium]